MLDLELTLHDPARVVGGTHRNGLELRGRAMALHRGDRCARRELERRTPVVGIRVGGCAPGKVDGVVEGRVLSRRLQGYYLIGVEGGRAGWNQRRRTTENRDGVEERSGY